MNRLKNILTGMLVLFYSLMIMFFIPSYLPAENTRSYGPKSFNDKDLQAVIQLFRYDKRIPIDARIVERISNLEKTYIREKIVFRGIDNSRMTGLLGIPQTGTPPYPCVLALHPLEGCKSDWWQDYNFICGGVVTKKLLAAGIAVFAMDARFHGEFQTHNNGTDSETFAETTSPGKLIKRYFDLLLYTTIEYRRVINYLSRRPEIDPHRIGVIGYSLGGIIAFLLTGVEPRVKVSVACVTPNLKRGLELIYEIKHPVDEMDILDPGHFARLVANRPFLMLMGCSDRFYSFEEANHLYTMIASSTKELVFYNSGHFLPEAYVSKARDWFRKYFNNP